MRADSRDVLRVEVRRRGRKALAAPRHEAVVVDAEQVLPKRDGEEDEELFAGREPGIRAPVNEVRTVLRRERVQLPVRVVRALVALRGELVELGPRACSRNDVNSTPKKETPDWWMEGSDRGDTI